MDVLSDDYLNWIKENTLDRNIYNFNFSDCRFIKIEELFLRVDEYAKSNYLFNDKEHEDKYILRFNDTFLEIGVLYGEESMYYIKRLEPKDVYSYFDINNIRNNIVKGIDNLEVSNLMNNLKCIIGELNNMQVPLCLVEKEVSEEVSKLTHKLK